MQPFCIVFWCCGELFAAVFGGCRCYELACGGAELGDVLISDFVDLAASDDETRRKAGKIAVRGRR